MNQTTVSHHYSIRSLIQFLIQQYKLIVGFPFVVGLITAIWMLNTPNIYRSSVLMSVSEEASGGGLNSLAGQLGGLASLAGLSVGNEGDNKVQVALAILQSKQFAKKFIAEQDIVVELFAASGWDINSKTLLLDNDIYDGESKTWVREVKDGKSPVPSDLELFDKYYEMLEIEENKTTGLITLHLNFYSPVLTEKWANALVNDLNDEVRTREVLSAQENIKYLNEQLGSLDNVDMRAVFFQLIEEQTKKLMLAEVKKDFIFSIIDPAVVPEYAYSPRRTLICLLAVIVSGFLVIVSLLIWFLIRPSSQHQ